MTKDMIIKEALILFANNGYDGTSIRQLASKVGIKESSIYSHFSSKEEIFRAIIQKYDSVNILENIDYDVLKSDTYDYLIQLLEYLNRAYLDDESMAYEKMVMIEGIKNGKLKDMILNETCNKIDLLCGKFLDFLISIDYLRDDIDKDMMFIQFVSPFYYIHLLLITHQYTQSQKIEKLNMMKRSLDFFLNTYKKDKK